jgi:hypothetical protein
MHLHAAFMEKILEFLFGGRACNFCAREVHIGLFAFQTASADVAAEIILGGTWAVGPLCMKFEMPPQTTVDDMHACHGYELVERPMGTALMFCSPTSPDRTQLPGRRDNSDQSGAASSFQCYTEHLAVATGGKQVYTSRDTAEPGSVTAGWNSNLNFLPPAEIILAQVDTAISGAAQDTRTLQTSEDAKLMQVAAGREGNARLTHVQEIRRETQSMQRPRTTPRPFPSTQPLSNPSPSTTPPSYKEVLLRPPSHPSSMPLPRIFRNEPRNLHRRCLRCLSYFHRAVDCRDPIVCWFCRASGHRHPRCPLLARLCAVTRHQMEPVVHGRPTCIDVHCPPVRDPHALACLITVEPDTSPTYL